MPSSGTSRFVAPFAGKYVLGFSLRFTANPAVPTKAIAASFKKGVELGGPAPSLGVPVDDVTTYNLSVLTLLTQRWG